MTTDELRQSFLKFFEGNGHTVVPSSSLLPTDPSVLFTTAGMQQFKPYYLGEKSPYGLNVSSCQKCFRTSDIEEVGDERHLTFFEMLGNFSFGGYFKKESIKYAFDFIRSLGLEIDYVTVFDPQKVQEGDWRKGVSKDEGSYEIWKELGISESQIRLEGEDNFWGPTGEEGPCGPTTEIYVKNHLGKSIEIWNVVFNEFFCDQNKSLTKLNQPGVDTGMGLERLAVMVQKTETVFETDLFQPLIRDLEVLSFKKYQDNQRLFRIIADHAKAAVFLISDGVTPSNLGQGYILRRLIRRTVRVARQLEVKEDVFSSLVEKVFEIYHGIYFQSLRRENVLEVIEKEKEKFSRTLNEGIKRFEKMIETGNVSGIDVFHLYDTYGFPLELTLEMAEEKGVKIEKEEFENAFKKHQEISRAGAEKKFGGVGKDASSNARLLHTATHLLHESLRRILGSHVRQMGSDITSERLRFDFSHPQKMTAEEVEKVEALLNEKIDADLVVKKEEMPFEEAVKEGALAFFKEKYPEIVNVYSVLDEKTGEVFSREICAGPHASRTSEIKGVKIEKEESSGAGVRRIRAVLK